jgi:hypothetical protein
MTTSEMLDKLGLIRDELSKLAAEKRLLLDAAFPAEIKKRLNEIEIEFMGKSDAANKNAAELEAQIKEAVLGLRETVRGESLMAVFAKGRVSWDIKKLDGYLIEHPELTPLRTQGASSVAIREVK